MTDVSDLDVNSEPWCKEIHPPHHADPDRKCTTTEQIIEAINASDVSLGVYRSACEGYGLFVKKQAHSGRKIPVWGKVVNSALYESQYADSKTSYEIGGGLRIIPDDRCLARWVNHQPQGSHHASLQFVCTRKENFRDLQWDEVYLQLTKRQKAFHNGVPKEMFFSYDKTVNFTVKEYKPLENKGGPFPDVVINDQKGAKKRSSRRKSASDDQGKTLKKTKAPEKTGHEMSPATKEATKAMTSTTSKARPKSSAADVQSPMKRPLSPAGTDLQSKKKPKITEVGEDDEYDRDDPPEPHVHPSGDKTNLSTCALCHNLFHRDEMAACATQDRKSSLHRQCLVDCICPDCHTLSVSNLGMFYKLFHFIL